MQVIDGPKRFGHHRNAFGVLRLLFASLVIVSHTPELVDGNRSRELLTRWFGSISFGELAVDGFFIISGFLISASFLASRTTWSYLLKRVARIYPAFIVATLVCVTIVAALGGAEGSPFARAAGAAAKALTLRPLESSYGAFEGARVQSLNGAMWTIQYEFRCYLLVVVLGLAGALVRPRLLASLSLACLVAAAAMPADGSARLLAWLNGRWDLHTSLWLGHPLSTLRLTGMFLAGAAFRAWQDRIPLRPALMLASAVAAIALMFSPLAAEIGIAVFGSYLIFGAAAFGRGTVLERINNREDVSYGLYLYAWPIEQLLIAAGLGTSLVLLGVATWIGALAAGALSWFLLEKPVMRLVRPAREGGATAAPAPHPALSPSAR